MSTFLVCRNTQSHRSLLGGIPYWRIACRTVWDAANLWYT